MQKRFDGILSSLGVRQKVLLAVSGGVDSMVMAALFLHSSLGISFEIAHCNFHLRGAESDSDEELVGNWCATNGVTFRKIDFDTKAYAQSKGISIEMAARELRYSWFSQLCIDNGFTALAVAHNANDNAETMILNLLRGTGLKGMTGMNPVSNIPVADASSSSVLIRPLLTFSRNEIKDYALSKGLQWHEDSTNADSAYKRNCVRNQIFPLFEKLNPSFLSTLTEDAQRFREEKAAADAFIKNVADSVVTSAVGAAGLADGKSELRINIKRLREADLPEYVLYRLIEPFGFTSAVSASIFETVTGNGTVSGKRFESADCIALTTGNEIIVVKKDCDAVADGSVLVTGDGEYSCGGTTFSVNSVAWAPEMPLKQPTGIIVLDSASVSFPFTVRTWREGDWMCPLGVRTASGKPGKKKVSDLFVDMKVPLCDKASRLVLSPGDGCDSHVLALLCSRIDESVKVGTDSIGIIRISL